MEEEKRGTIDLKLPLSSKEETGKRLEEDQRARDLKGKEDIAVLAPSFNLIQQQQLYGALMAQMAQQKMESSSGGGNVVSLKAIEVICLMKLRKSLLEGNIPWKKVKLAWVWEIRKGRRDGL